MEIREKILIISAPDPDRHAGVAARNIYKMFKSKGHLVTVLTKELTKQNTNYVSYNNKIRCFFNKVKHKVFHTRKKFKAEYHFISQSSINTKINRIVKLIPFSPDIIIILFPHNFLDFEILLELNNHFSSKIIWQLIDMSPFTGGCHYSWDCIEYQNQCNNCPAVLKEKFKIIPHKTLLKNLEIINKLDLSISVGSDWLFNHAKSSVMFHNKLFVKNYLYVDKEIFKPKFENEKKKFKENYSIPSNSFVISFGAYSLNDKRKGIKYIIEAINQFGFYDDVTILVIGNGSKDLKGLIKNLPLIELGNIDREFLPSFYYASSIFINASLQDVGPYMLLESLFCNTPVISFSTGFANEFINNTETIKYLIKDFSSQEIVNSLKNSYEYFKKNGELNVINLPEIRGKIKEEIIYKNYLDLFRPTNE